MDFILTLTSNIPRLFAMIYLEKRRVVWKRVKGNTTQKRAGGISHDSHVQQWYSCLFSTLLFLARPTTVLAC